MRRSAVGRVVLLALVWSPPVGLVWWIAYRAATYEPEALDLSAASRSAARGEEVGGLGYRRNATKEAAAARTGGRGGSPGSRPESRRGLAYAKYAGAGAMARGGAGGGTPREPQPTTETGPASAGPEEIGEWAARLFAPPLAGAVPAGGVELFRGDELYARIDGAAPRFIARGFEVLAAVTMRVGDGEFDVEVYRMRSAEAARAVAAEERSPGAGTLAVGRDGWRERFQVAFCAGRHFVKLTAFDESADRALEEVARSLAARLR